MRKMCPSRTVREAAGQRAAMTRRRRQSIIVEAVLPVYRSLMSARSFPLKHKVIVIAPGGDDAVVVKNITEAVQALFEIDTHKIRIMKGGRVK